MNYHEDCPCCHRRTSAYTLPMNRGLARAFLKFVDARLLLERPVDKGELKLTNAEYSNFQNLRHFGLVAQKEQGRAWDWTERGLAFFHGAPVESPVAHFGGETLPSDHLAWATHTGPRGNVTIAELLPAEWKEREAFVREKKDAVA